MSAPEHAALEIRFLAGRYHATPWGRHVNEAAVAWPPEPWRLLRGLVAVWHRKADHDRFPEPVLAALVEGLSQALPRYRLPPGTHAHLQHYMPIPKGRSETTTLVYDGFLRLDPETPLIVHWPDVRLAAEPRALFAHLAERLGYLGRAESWAEARSVDEVSESGEVAAPWEELAESDRERYEICELLAPVPASEYPAWRQGALATAGELGRRDRARAEATLPERFLDLLRLETDDVQAAGWSRFPGTRLAPYGRPREWDRPHRTAGRSTAGKAAATARRRTTVRLALSGRPLPRVEDTVRVGEALRAALLHQVGTDEAPPVLTGRDAGTGSAAEGHEHLFFLPEDGDGDGWIDHVLLHAEAGLEEVLPLLARLEHAALWLQHDPATRWRVFFEMAGEPGDFGHVSSLLPKSGACRIWQSCTPYLHPWHAKRRFGPGEQIARELSARTFSGRSIALAKEPEPLSEIDVGGTSKRALAFHRFRGRRGLSQPDRHGSFWRLELDEPIAGPLALGFGCHFGLGLFVPVDEDLPTP